jgi:hypothetical protein
VKTGVTPDTLLLHSAAQLAAHLESLLGRDLNLKSGAIPELLMRTPNAHTICACYMSL